MRKLLLTALALLCLMTIVAACSQKSEVPEQSNLNLQISKSEPDGRSYTVYKKIEDNDTVEQSKYGKVSKKDTKKLLSILETH
ncbi:hypothetical protein [Paenibacillus sp. YAF4_2]|uniref:hypothetical protein n=1 Tax=Paenibacillus sp. YAF4_2 TaxID=3233085 RepID=UPI003F9E3439